MNMKITRDVIADLWPLYVDGSVGADSRALIEEFLKEDPQWAQALRQGREANGAPCLRRLSRRIRRHR